MAENLQGAHCTQAEFEAAQAAGLHVITSAHERAIHAFAEAIRSQAQCVRHEPIGIIERIDTECDGLAKATVGLLRDVEAGASVYLATTATHNHLNRIQALEHAAGYLKAALSELMEATDEPPEKNCSCHISPPCGDCVDHSGLRDAWKTAQDAIEQYAAIMGNAA